MSKKCKAFSESKLGLETSDNRKAFYAGWDAAKSEQPSQQEPVAWANPNDLQNFDMKVRTNGGPLHTVPLYTRPQAPEPVIDKSAAIRIATALGWEPKREWVGLTDEDVETTFWPWKQFTEYSIPLFEYRVIARAIESKLREKNNG